MPNPTKRRRALRQRWVTGPGISTTGHPFLTLEQWFGRDIYCRRPTKLFALLKRNPSSELLGQGVWLRRSTPALTRVMQSSLPTWSMGTTSRATQTVDPKWVTLRNLPPELLTDPLNRRCLINPLQVLSISPRQV